jgi:hypothetical protein
MLAQGPLSSHAISSIDGLSITQSASQFGWGSGIVPVQKRPRAQTAAERARQIDEEKAALQAARADARRRAREVAAAEAEAAYQLKFRNALAGAIAEELRSRKK